MREVTKRQGAFWDSTYKNYNGTKHLRFDRLAFPFTFNIFFKRTCSIFFVNVTRFCRFCYLPNEIDIKFLLEIDIQITRDLICDILKNN